VSAKQVRVDLPASKLKPEIARILQDRGTSRATASWTPPPKRASRAAGDSPVPEYGPHGEKVITGIERISRPGRRVYLGVDDVPPVLGGLGTNILTTSRGVMTGRAARKAGVGGEVLCNVW